MDQQSTVICVLSQEQRTEYEAELGQLELPGVRVLLRHDADLALEECAATEPNVVIVGMEVGEMDGLEFLARLLSKNRSWNSPIVVLPDKSDNFPPVIHSRNLETGHSAADETDFAGIVRLVRGEPQQEATDAAPAAAVAEPQPAPIAEPRSSEPEMPLAPLGGQPTQRRMLPLVGAAVFVVVASVGYAVYRSVDDSAPVASSAAVEPASAANSSPVASPPATAEKASAASAGESAEGGQPSEGSDPAQGDQPSQGSEPAEGDQPSAAAQAGADPSPGGQEDSPETVSDPQAEGASDGAARAASAAAAAADALAQPAILPVAFSSGSPRPSETDKTRIGALARRVVLAFKAAPDARLEVGGHASAEGSTLYNRQLGLARAEAAKRTLVRLGVPANRISTKSFGATQPIGSNDTEEGRRQNRRVTVRLLR